MRTMTLHTVDSLPRGRRAAVRYDNGNIRTRSHRMGVKASLGRGASAARKRSPACLLIASGPVASAESRQCSVDLQESAAGGMVAAAAVLGVL